MVRLSALKPGDVAIVQSLEVAENLYRRLLDLGFMKGSVIRVVRRSPLGDPTAYRLRGATYVLRESESRLIWVGRSDSDAR